MFFNRANLGKMVGVLLCVLIGLVCLGGVHCYRFSRYVPTASGTRTSESNFQINIFPEFTSGGSGGVVSVIPGVLYYDVGANKSAFITLGIVPVSDKYGYNGKVELVLESLRVISDANDDQVLVEPKSPRHFVLTGTTMKYNHERIAPVRGESLELSVVGYVIDSSGEKKAFTHQQKWIVKRTWRLGFGFLFSE